MVSRTIEGAQTRVEGYNFDIRKRVVEFDDVINMQRATVYGERDRVLRGENLTLTIQDALHGEVRALAVTHCPPGLTGEWNRSALATELKRLGIEPPASLDTLVEDSLLYEAVDAAADAALEKKAVEVGEELWPRVERAVILRSIDQLWVEHLTEVDDLRRGIGLRGHAQVDPLNAFKIEAFKLYEEFQSLIRVSIGRAVLRVSLVQEQRASTPVAVKTVGGSSEAAVATPSASPTATPSMKAGRNDACPCGSGKKFKKCHGA
jgi:preprotein translocase subunit SecA